MNILRAILLVSSLLIIAEMARAQEGNFALNLDGKDNNPCIGMGIIRNQWTIEAWIKGDGDQWKNKEAIVGIGEYSEINMIDPLPLMLKNGRLHSAKADISAPQVLDQHWHHVAVSCDGVETKLYLDGQQVASGQSAADILPGEIGTSDIDSTGFGGSIDEVRIWSYALSGATLRKWMFQPLTAAHPGFANLKAYYNFDGLENNVSLNLVGKGVQPYHLRNTRKKYNEDSPLAYLVKNDNLLFAAPGKKQKLFNAVVIQSEWDADQGTKNDPLLKLRIVVNGSGTALKLTALKLDLSGSTSLLDISKVHVYYTGQSPSSRGSTELFGTGTQPDKHMHFKENPANAFPLKHGVNYFLVTLDIKNNAAAGDTMQAKVSSYFLDGKAYVPEEDQSEPVFKLITPNSLTNSNTVKLLQWNIWHGGIHMGRIEGPDRIEALIRSTHADIVTMQEGYGIQKALSKSLGFNMYTASPKDNLALFSRFPMEAHPSAETFKSNMATITLPGNQKLLIANWWLRYAYKHEYTGSYNSTGLDTKEWIAEDKQLGAVDAANNLEKDIDPIRMSDPAMPVIIAGDFNSASHLDWTARAACLHNGYGPVDFPISKLMLERGYTDSYRHVNPDEVTHPVGTFAAIYGHMQTLRIDYIYYKGPALRAKFSKIVRTPPEIDDVWPSDHSAVLTVFEID